MSDGNEILYTKTHEWVKKVDGEVIMMGITDYAQSELSDVVFVDIPEVGVSIGQGDIFMSIESVKSASDIYAPISGEIVVVNETLQSNPEKINDSAEGDGWLVKIKPLDFENDSTSLLSKESYAKETTSPE